MTDEKKIVKMWNSSWFNLLYAMSMNLPLLNDRQYYTTFNEFPADSGNYHIKSQHARINTGNILKEIAKQLNMTAPLKEALEVHRRTEEALKSGKESFTAKEAREIEVNV